MYGLLNKVTHRLGFKGSRERELRAQLADFEHKIRKQHDVLEELKEEIALLERGMVKQKKELDANPSERQRRIIGIQITTTFNDIKMLQGREQIATANLNNLSVLKGKLFDIVNGKPVATDEEVDIVAAEVEELYDLRRGVDRAAEGLAGLLYRQATSAGYQATNEVSARYTVEERKSVLSADVEIALEQLQKSER